MFHPLPLFIGLRYARARAHRYFVSFITWVSLAGVCVGVAALIVILSVMNGFESELRTRLVELSFPVRVTIPAEGADWERLRSEVQAVAPDVGIERHAELEVLALREPETVALTLRSADALTREVLDAKLVQGRIEELDSNDGVIIGALAADKLGVLPGDPVRLLVPVITGGDLPEFRMRQFTVVGVFKADLQDHDGQLAYVSLAGIQNLGATRSRAEGLNLRMADAMAAPALAEQLRQRLGADWPGLKVTDWTEEHASYFRAIRIEKTMMALILMLVVAVAAFNIVAMLVMVVTDKRTDIAILRTFGAGPRTVAGAFVTQGLLIGWLGVAAGVGLGVLVADNVTPILQALDRYTGITVFDADVYLITDVPSELHWPDVWLIAACALALTALATVYPALRAAGVSPAEALRYE
jgi:lipoprotein-releasing system permease protein